MGITSNTLTLTRALKIVFQETRPELADFLKLFFPTVKTYDTTEIPADTIPATGRLARYREVNAASNILAFLPGKGYVYNPATLDESTPITEELARAVTAGLEANAPAQQQILEKVAQIQNMHDAIFTAAIVKQAMDILTFGIFQPTGKGGGNIGAPFDFERDPDNTITGSTTAIDALQAAYDQYKAKGGSATNLFAIIGAEVLSELEKDTDFQNALRLQGVNAGYSRLVGDNRVVADIIPGGFKIPGRAARASLLAFDESYENESGAMVPFMNPKGIIFSSFNAPRIQAYGGIFIVNAQTGSGAVHRGEIINDALWKKDPDSIILRSQSRPILIPGNIDHVVYAEIA